MIIEQNQHRLLWRFQKSLWGVLLISITLIPFSLFLCLLGLVLQRADYPGIIAVVSGCVILGIVLYTIINDTEITTYTFDKVKNSLLWERRNRFKIVHTKSVEFPCHLISGIEIEDVSGSEGGIAFYPRLILASISWRFILKSNGSHESAVSLAKTIAQFLDIPYFASKSEAPTSTLDMKIMANREPGQSSWQYLENEVELLRQQLDDHPHDPDIHQDLGISLYYLNRWIHRKEAITHLQQAERLFESTEDSDRAAIARVMAALVSWNY
ncbi:hypothetical protein [Nostoc sp. 'Lobaria pulmonaria (5183) cyanobiont']|uniref:hypothetical protein n=1 Tax=Nostoc sp. 'Lobaria pulmonaria (5183) cyanobiont' TaxID=1618022 RepID=UPI000CF355E2|nr:hypothetical protein [Nostoc sp. 'Lobaria pulmonaria (5183) cyanobiont']AVH72091.1 hypothetical protein NLP_3557 [Nostoc sp. 'Lobaria pulmonaria (5183) cyanobiont']